MSTEETLLFSSSDYNSDDLARLLELQRRQAELRDPNVEEFVLDEEEEEEEEDDDFSVTGGSRRNNKKGPTVPDMRFEKQFEKSIESLREKGTSNMGILWSAVIKDQIIIPFLSGFTWNLCSVAWKWYRTSSRGVINAKGPAGKRFGFFKGIQHGVSEWTKLVYNAISRNASFLLTTTAQTIEATKDV